MSEEEIRKMCSNIYEGEEWQPMIDLVQSKDKEIKSLKQALKDTIESSKIIEKEQKEEIERLNNIINNTAVEHEILLQSENFELITMQLRNIVFRLKGSDKNWKNILVL